MEWTAPGDDGTTGLVQSYDLRYATAPITEANFGQATQLSPRPPPLSAGTSQTWIVSGLPNEAELYFALRARDDAGNWSSASNSPSARTLDVAPRRISDLRQTGRGPTSVAVAWSAPGDDGAVGTATRYDLRWSTTPIDESNFASARVAPAPTPQASGRPESVTISGLASDGAYYVAIRGVDDRENAGALSNVVRVQTADTRPPARIADLTVIPRDVPTSVSLTWTAPGDDGNDGVATRYQVRRSESPIVSDATWNAAAIVPSAPRPSAAGAQEALPVYQLIGETTYYFAVRAYDEDDNAGPLSNSAMGTTASIPPSPVADLSATPGPNQVVLAWTAPWRRWSNGASRKLRRSVCHRVDNRRELRGRNPVDVGAFTGGVWNAAAGDDHRS